MKGAKVEGVEDTMRLLKKIQPNPKDLRKGIESIAMVIVNDAKARASFSKNIQNSIGLATVGAEKYPSFVLIRPKYPQGSLAHIFENGTAPRFTKDGNSRGQITARPFMRPALDSNKQAVQDRLKNLVIRLIEKEAKKNNLK